MRPLWTIFSSSSPVAAQPLDPADYAAFRAFLEEACGIVLGENKEYLVFSRLSRLMAEQGLDSLRDLVSKAGGGAVLRERIVDAMTTNETLWFRDGYPFEVFKQKLLPEVAAERRANLRIWSAACSTGEEPYSLAMAIAEYQIANPGRLPADIQIVATDISSSVLAQARTGQYEEKNLARGLSAERRQRFFVNKGARWEVREEIRRRVRFQEINLKSSYALLGKFDMIFCRNVLIYFSGELKSDILNRMAERLQPRGVLVLGASESLSGYSEAFEMVRCQPGVVYRLKGR
jgi:chemotaxis protein methyltransferase CheR